MIEGNAPSYAPSQVERVIGEMLERHLSSALPSGGWRRAENEQEIAANPLQIQGGTFAAMLEPDGADTTQRGDDELLFGGNVNLRITYGVPLDPLSGRLSREAAMQAGEAMTRCLHKQERLPGLTCRSAGVPRMTIADGVIVCVLSVRAMWTWDVQGD